MFDEGSIVLKRISLSKFGSIRKAAYKRRLLFDTFQIMTQCNCTYFDDFIFTNVTKLTHKIPILTHAEIKNSINWLVTNNFIHTKKHSDYRNRGFLIKINDRGEAE